MKKKFGACLLSVLLLLSALAGCDTAGGTDTTGDSGAHDTVPTNPASPETTVPQQTTAPQPAVPARPEQVLGDGYVVVKALYGDLRYQDQWHGYMQAEQSLAGDVLTVRFSTQIGGTDYLLFTLTIGDPEGIVSGQLTGSDGVTRNVCVHMDAIVGSSELTDDELTRLYAMQEDINYMIDYLE